MNRPWRFIWASTATGDRAVAERGGRRESNAVTIEEPLPTATKTSPVQVSSRSCVRSSGATPMRETTIYSTELI